MSRPYDALVIGLGAMGSAAAMHLARRGARVLGIEASGIPNSGGSSHGFSRAIRLCYSEHPDYVPLLQRSYALWDQLQQLCGRRLLHITGGLYIGPAASAFVSGAARAAAAHGLQHQLLNRAELAERWPQFAVPDDHGAFYEPSAGVLLPEAAIAAHAELAIIAGAELHTHEKVTAWSRDGAGYRVQTSAGQYSAARLVLTAGPWLSSLLPGIPCELRVTRQTLAWFAPAQPAALAWPRLPVWAVSNPDDSIYYGFPLLPGGDGGVGGAGFKLALHRHGPRADPDSVDRSISQSDWSELDRFVRRHLPAAAGPLLDTRVCLYTSTPDSHFLIGSPADDPGVVYASPCSGHGFKFAPVVGQALADLAFAGRTDLPISFLSPERFAR